MFKLTYKKIVIICSYCQTIFDLKLKQILCIAPVIVKTIDYEQFSVNMEQSFSRIVSDFNETFCTCLFSPQTKSFMLNSLIFTSVAMETKSKVFDQKVPKNH